MPGQPVIDLLLLTSASGVLDALSYMRAHVFTANMTGKTIILGLAIIGPGNIAGVRFGAGHFRFWRRCSMHQSSKEAA